LKGLLDGLAACLIAAWLAAVISFGFEVLARPQWILNLELSFSLLVRLLYTLFSPFTPTSAPPPEPH
jgi:hypothetical protein